MSKSNNRNRGVRILNATGVEWVSAKQAIKWLKQDPPRARYVDETSIEMIESDHRNLSALRSLIPAEVNRTSSPTPLPVMVNYEYDGPENLRTFARYPDTDTFRRAA